MVDNDYLRNYVFLKLREDPSLDILHIVDLPEKNYFEWINELPYFDFVIRKVENFDKIILYGQTHNPSVLDESCIEDIKNIYYTARFHAERR